jgi:hypothetical protein
MKQNPVQNVRNVCVMGHGGDGKNFLIEGLCFKQSDRRHGKVADGIRRPILIGGIRGKFQFQPVSWPVESGRS